MKRDGLRRKAQAPGTRHYDWDSENGGHGDKEKGRIFNFNFLIYYF